MNIGQFNERITYTNPGASTPDNIGGFIITPGTPTETWCKARQISQKESISFGLNLSESNYEFTFRFEIGRNITTETELTYKGRSFRVVAPPRMLNESDRFYVVLASERRV